MRIGIVCPYSFDEPGGVQIHVLDLAQHFRAQGHEVQVLGPCGPDTEVPDFVTRGGKSVPIPYNGSVARLTMNPTMVAITKEFIAEGNFDVLHIHEPSSPSYSLVALQVAEGPIVATYHASSSGSRILKMATPILRPRLEKIRGGIAVSDMARRWQVEMLGGDPILIPNGVDTGAFAHARIPLNDPPKEIVFLGRLDESRKGLPILLEALDYLTVPYHVTVMGAGTQTPHEHVDYVGRVTDAEKERILGQADIYVAPNTGGESFGIVLVEAMAAGCVVVASDIEAFAAVCDVEAEQPAGLLFRNGDPQDLAAKLEAVMRDPANARALRKAGEDRAQRYDWDTVAAEIMLVYETVQDGTKVRV